MRREHSEWGGGERVQEWGPFRARVLQRKIVWQGYDMQRMLGLGRSAIQRERCMLEKEQKGWRETEKTKHSKRRASARKMRTIFVVKKLKVIEKVSPQSPKHLCCRHGSGFSYVRATKQEGPSWPRARDCCFCLVLWAGVCRAELAAERE